MQNTSFLRMACVLLPALVFVPACDSGDDEETSVASASDTDASSSTTSDEPEPEPEPEPGDSSTTDDEVPAGCECIIDEDDVDVPSVPSGPTCSAPICDVVVTECESDCGGGIDGEFDPVPIEIADAEALSCALTALRDRTPGIVTWSHQTHGGQYTDDGYILIRDDGTAVRRNFGNQDLVYDASAAVLGELAPSADYDACLAEPDDLVRVECLWQGLATETTVCDEGWQVDNGGF